MADKKRLPAHIRQAFENGAVVTLAGKIYASADEFPDDWEEQGYGARRAAARERRGLDAVPARRVVAEEATRKKGKD